MPKAKMLKIISLSLSLLLLLIFPLKAEGRTLNAASVLLINLTTDKILFQQNPNRQIAPASLAKIMTMFLAFDAIKAKKLSFNQKILVSARSAAAGGSSMRLNPGERTPVSRLLAGMAVASGNDAAMALATAIAGSPAKFTKKMNAKAARLKMASTKFKNPTGLPAAGQKTTAIDLALLCKAYLRTHPQAMRFHGMSFFMHKGRAAHNTNPLLGVVKGVDGLKTGWTVASGYNLIVTAKRGKTRLLAIILGAPSKAARDAAARALLKAGFANAINPAKVKKALGG